MKILKYLLFLLPFIPLFIFRDFTPNNELKYISIVEEAIRDGHFFTFWNHGAVYADKPPFYFWLLIGSKLILGAHYMWALSLFSMLPALVVLLIMDKWTGNMIPQQQHTTNQLMLLTSGLFLGSAIVLRMDMMMCMFIVLALYTFYKIYKGDNSLKNKILLPLYIFMAIFTKGPVGLIVPLFSILTFLIIKKEIRHFGRYLGWLQWGLLLGLSVVWFGCVYLEGGNEYLNNLLFNQTVNRAVDSFHHKAPIYYYFTTIWHSLAPWVLFYVLAIIIGIRKRLIDTDIKKLFLAIIGSTFIILSLFSSKLDIYMLPVFPFIAYLAFLLAPQIKEKYILFTITIPAVILTLVFPAALIIGPYITSIEIPFIVYLSILVLSVSGALALYFLYWKKLYPAINSMTIGLLLTIFLASFAIPQFNKYIGFRDMAELAKVKGDEHNIDNFYFYSFRSGENMDAYFHKAVPKLEIDKIDSLGNKEKFILLIRNKDLGRDENLQQVVKNKDIYPIADYSVVLFEANK